ncbi:MAG TPA: hypothetical protein VMU13_00900 [Candidatus Paceibacterota bacterium]|nr:hypothetical protein [Candidatus Paceibacterota bacterium]
MKKRGASVLAALVLVAILGAVFVVLQYARSVGSLAYEPTALTAADASAAPQPASASTQPKLQGCNYDPTTSKQTCPCNQTAATPTIAGGIQESVEQCQFGCKYKIIPGKIPKVSSLDPPGKFSNPNADACTIRVCTTDDVCSEFESTGDYQLSKYGPQLSALGIANATSPGIATQLAKTYTTNSDSGYLTDLQNSLTGAGGESNYQTPQAQANIDAAQKQLTDLEGDSGTGDTSSIPPTGGQVCVGGECTSLTNPDLSKIAQPCAITNGQAGTNDVPCSNPTTAPDNTNPASGCKTAACVDGNTNNYGGSGDTFQGPCPQGQTNNGTGCSGTTPPPGGGAGTGGTGGTGGNGNSGLGGLLSNNGLTQFATGLFSGIAKGMAQQQAQQQAQQAYQQALQQQAAANSPYGTGADGNACPQPQLQPSASLCTVGVWQQQRLSNGCPTTWQCVANGSNQTQQTIQSNTQSNTQSTSTQSNQTTPTQPSASLSCQPQSADVGMTVSMSYSCTDATGSSGGGFSTGNQLSGSTQTVITAPPPGNNTASYTLTCLNQSLTASAQCAIQINQPSIVLVANPNVVTSGSASAIGWVTSGMKSCIISSPDSSSFTSANASNTSVNGIATTSALTAPMTVALNCTTINGGTRQATATITIGTSTAATGSGSEAVTVSATDNGATSTIAHGDNETITWNSVNPPSGSAMSLWLVNNQTQKTQAVIAGGLAPNGVYTWHVPAVGATCNANASNVCDTDLVAGGSYAIEAVLYTPSNAYVGDGTEPNNPIQPTYGNSGVTNSFTVQDGGE